MTDEEITTRLSDEEDSFTERKTEGDHKDFLKTVVAFSNSVPSDRTAILFVGVQNDGTVVGLKNPDSTQKTFREIFTKKCYPTIDPIPEMRVLKHSDRQYLAILIRTSRNRPHFAGPAWVREGSMTVQASDRMFQELIDSRTSKVYEILKWKNQQVRVEAIGKKLGDTKPLGNPQYREACDCIVVGCTSHAVRLERADSNQHVSEPLANVTVMDDVPSGRLKLVVRGP